MNLSDAEIRKRLVRLRNLEKLHSRARERIVSLEAENKALKQRIAELERADKNNHEKMETLALRVEELQTMVFGKKHKRNEHFRTTPTQQKTVRTKASYTRPIPSDNEITKRERHRIHRCPDCATQLTRKRVTVFYEEDIPIPARKTVIRHNVEKGYCVSCKKWKPARALPASRVILGETVKRYICYCSILLRLSYRQTRQMLLNMYGLSVSDGEITRILHAEAVRLNPAYERLKETIRAQPGVHMDETGWTVQRGTHGNHAWVMTGTETPDTVFSVGKSRGKGVAEELKGDSDAVLVSDDYAVYKSLADAHQLCMAHPLRKLRDIARSDMLSEKKRVRCMNTYAQFTALYTALTDTLNQPLEKRTRKYPIFINQLLQLAEPHVDDPEKLKRIKISLLKNASAYFTCLLHDTIPADNNKAERALRHLVIKRKLSFGSRTDTGAHAMSVLLSVLYSLQQKHPLNFFQQYMAL